MRTRGKRWKKLAATAIVAGVAAPTVLRWLRRTGAARRTVNLRTTLIIERPIHDVFEFCRDFENFPKIVDVLLSVEDSQDGRSHWAVRSPTGHAVEWDATVTKYVPNSVIAWESVAGSAVFASGLMRFSPLSPAETRVDLTLTYRPMHTQLADALRAMMTPTNTERLKSELTHAPQELSRPEPGADQEPPRPEPSATQEPPRPEPSATP